MEYSVVFTATASQTHTKQTEDNVELKQSKNEYSEPPDKDNARASTDTFEQICLWQQILVIVDGGKKALKVFNFLVNGKPLVQCYAHDAPNQ